MFIFIADLKPCFDPFCTQFCHLSSQLLTTMSDLSDAAKTRLVEFGLVTVLLQALIAFKEVNFNNVRGSGISGQRSLISTT